MSKSLIGASLLFSEPNCPTREGELIKSLSDMENIPAPYLGMKVFVEDEGKCFFVSKLKAKVVDGVPVADAVVAELLPFGGTKKVVWSNDSAPLSNMNDFTTAGVYELSGEHTRIDDNLPIANTGSGHTFNARLTVLDSSIPDTTNSDDKCITQLLAFSNRLGQGEVYIRTGKGRTLDSLTWGAWSTLQRNVNVGQVENLDDFVDNGIYSGVWLTGSYQSYPLTFVCIVINDYFIKTGTRRISQFIYGLSKFDGSTEFKCRIKEEGKDWGDWEIINKKEISKMIKDVTDGIEPDKIDSIKDIISWIEEHGGEVTAIYNAINNLSTLITEETTRAESSEQALDDKINDEIERAKAAEKSIDDKLANIDVLDGIKNKVVAIDGMDVVYQSDDVDIEFDTLGDNRNNITIGAATENTAGVMSAKDKKKLDSISEGGGGDITATPTEEVIEEIEPTLVSTALRKTPQVLTDSEKEIARNNIGAQKGGNYQLLTEESSAQYLKKVNASGGGYISAKNYIVSSDKIYRIYGKHNIPTSVYSAYFATNKSTTVGSYDYIDTGKGKEVYIDITIRGRAGFSYLTIASTLNVEEIVGNSCLLNTPSGDLSHYLYLANGAEYNMTDQPINRTTFWNETVEHLPNHWYLNGLGDITNEEMVNIYNYKEAFFTIINKNGDRYFQDMPAPRTIFFYGYRFGLGKVYENYYVISRNIEVWRWGETQSVGNKDNAPSIKNTEFFYQLNNLKYIDTTKFTKNFTLQAPALIEGRFVTSFNLNIGNSVNISKASVLYAIQNATPTSAITITLHADAYARLKDDADIVAALAAQPLITLVSA